MYASRRTGNPRFGSGRADSPNIEVAAALLEWRRGEQHVYEAPRVRFELPSLGCRVAVSQDQQVDLRCGIPVVLDGDHRPWWWRFGNIHKTVLGIHARRPD